MTKKLASFSVSSNSVNIGNAGEHLVAAHLLSLGFHVFVADRNNRAFDLSVFHNGKHSLLRVKTSSNYCVQWCNKKDGFEFDKIWTEYQDNWKQLEGDFGK